MLGVKDTAEYDRKQDIEKMTFSGLLAQDVETAAKSINYDFSGVDKSGKLLSLRYSDFVVPMIKAIQEQQAMIEELKNQNTELIKRIEKLETK